MEGSVDTSCLAGLELMHACIYNTGSETEMRKRLRNKGRCSGRTHAEQVLHWLDRKLSLSSQCPPGCETFLKKTRIGTFTKHCLKSHDHIPFQFVGWHQHICRYPGKVSTSERCFSVHVPVFVWTVYWRIFRRNYPWWKRKNIGTGLFNKTSPRIWLPSKLIQCKLNIYKIQKAVSHWL